jgi:hypothetical protein
MAGAVETMVKREVDAAMHRQQAEPEELLQPTEQTAAPPAPDLTSDETARQLLRRMRELAEEERFRNGQI